MGEKLSAGAQGAGAGDTRVVDHCSSESDSTDGVWVVRELSINAGVAIKGQGVLIVGAGGKAQGVILPLLEQAPYSITLCNRTQIKAEELVQQFSHPSLQACAIDALGDAYDLVINATSAGLSGDLPPIPAAVFGATTFAYDMIYAAQATTFMQLAQSHGAQVRDGLGMLVEQAAESFYLWRGVRPDTASGCKCLRAHVRDCDAAGGVD